MTVIRSVTRTLGLLWLSLPLFASPFVCDASADFHCTPPQLWQTDFAAPPRIPCIGDADADGYDDLLCLWPVGGIADISLNARGEKAVFHTQARTDFGTGGLGAACGRFTACKGAGLMTVLPDGSVRLASETDESRNHFRRDDNLGKLPGKPKPPVKMTAGDVDGDGYDEAIVLDATGRVFLIDVEGQAPPKAVMGMIGRVAPGTIAIATGDFEGTGKAVLVYQDRKGVVRTSVISAAGLGKSRRLVNTRPGSDLVAANLDDDNRSDLVVGTTVFWGGNPKNSTEWSELAASGPGILAAGHIRGDRRHDLVRFRRTSDQYEQPPLGEEPYSKYDVFVHFTYRAGDPDPTNCGLTLEEKKRLGLDPMRRDTSGDGLLDGWKVKGTRGLNLPALGVNPLKKNIVCEITPIGFPDSELPKLRAECDSISAYYASLPTRNPDGSRGINVLFIILENQPGEVAKISWGENGEKFHDKTHRGVTHWIQVSYSSGGGQSSQMGDRGGCGWHAFYATFIHEFGHQLGLDHNGFWSGWSPTYKSLMNYSYSYHHPISYSRGILRGLVLRQDDLSEVLPYKIKYVRFLGDGPYKFKLKEDGDNTLIDWNRNGVFDKERVKARITDSYSVDTGPTLEGGLTVTAPLVTACGKKDLLLFYGKEKEAGADGKKPVALMMASFKPVDQFGDAEEIDPAGITGDPRAASDGKSVWLFYATENGTLYRQVVKVGDKWRALEAKLMPDTVGTQVEPCFFNGKLHVFLWSSRDKDIEYTILSNGVWSERKSLGVISNVPVGAGVDTVKNQIILACAKDDGEWPNRWDLRYFAADASGTLTQTQMRRTMGDKGWARGDTQPNIIFETGKDAGPEGRIHMIFGSARNAEKIGGIWVVEEIGDKSIDGGWVLKRHGNEWVNSLNGPTATWFNDDIVTAYRWYGDAGINRDNDLHVNFHCLGINHEPMGDFDDITFIDTVGVQHSVLRAQTKQ